MAQRFLALMASAAAIVGMTSCAPSVPTATDSQPAQPANAETAASPSPNQFRVVENVALPTPGPDPMLMVMSLRQAPTERIGSEDIRVVYRSPEKAIVTFTQAGLPDDSVRAKRTRYEFAPAEGSANGQPLWKITQVTEQVRCQPERGSQEWTGELCK